jgi:hypothetical protein
MDNRLIVENMTSTIVDFAALGKYQKCYIFIVMRELILYFIIC